MRVYPTRRHQWPRQLHNGSSPQQTGLTQTRAWNPVLCNQLIKTAKNNFSLFKTIRNICQWFICKFRLNTNFCQKIVFQWSPIMCEIMSMNGCQPSIIPSSSTRRSIQWRTSLSCIHTVGVWRWRKDRRRVGYSHHLRKRLIFNQIFLFSINWSMQIPTNIDLSYSNTCKEPNVPIEHPILLLRLTMKNSGLFPILASKFIKDSQII